MRQISTWRVATLLLLATGVFFFQLGTPRLWDRDEPRNAGAAREMLNRGDWIVPTFNHALRDHKPVLLYWGQMTAALLIGDNEWSARLPSALAAVLAMLGTAVLASRMTGRYRGISQEGFWAAGVLGTCLMFVVAGRAATPDGCLIAFSTLGIALLAMSALSASPPYSSGCVGRARRRLAAAGYAMLGLAVLAKGPVGLILPLAVVLLWWLINYRLQTRGNPHTPSGLASNSSAVIPSPLAPTADASGHASQPLVQMLRLRSVEWITEGWHTFHPGAIIRALSHLRVWSGLCIVLLVSLPWYIAVGIETDGAFLRGFFFEHNLGRAFRSLENHGGGIWFYPVTLLCGLFPWSLWLIPLLTWSARCWRENAAMRQLVLLSACWVAVYVGAFSLASTKLPSYITPCYPGVALLLGVFLRQFETQWSVPARFWRQLYYALAVAVGVGVAIGTIIASNALQMPGVQLTWIAGGAIALIGLCAFVLDRTGAVRAVPAICLIGAAVFQMVIFAVGAPRVSEYRDDVAALIRLQHEQPTQDWAAVGSLEPSWVYYLRCHIQEFTPGPNVDVDLVAERLKDWLQARPMARLVVVGETGKAVMEQAANDSWLEGQWSIEIATHRFLDDDEFIVYRWDRGGTAVADQSANSNNWVH